VNDVLPHCEGISDSLARFTLINTPAFRPGFSMNDGDEPFQQLILSRQNEEAVETAFGAIVAVSAPA